MKKKRVEFEYSSDDDQLSGTDAFGQPLIVDTVDVSRKRRKEIADRHALITPSMTLPLATITTVITPILTIEEHPVKSETKIQTFVDDMFSTSLTITQPLSLPPQNITNKPLEEGYFVPSNSQKIDKYTYISTLGSGVFSIVLKCSNDNHTTNNYATDTNSESLVAIKILRKLPTPTSQYKREKAILEIIAQKKNIKGTSNIGLVQYFGSFQIDGFQCLVFELMSLNLREVLAKHGGSVGLNISAVRIYATQLVQALQSLKSLNIIQY